MNLKKHIRARSLFWLFPVLALIEIYSLFPFQPSLDNRTPHPNYLRGAYHVHSEFSHDATGTIEEIARAAGTAGLDFVIVTDHNTMEGHRRGLDKSYSNVDIYIESELSLAMGHAVSFTSHTKADQQSDSGLIAATQGQIEHKRTISPGAFQVIAHPTNRKRPWERVDLFGDGLEVVNLDSVWREQVADSLGDAAVTGLVYAFNPYLALLRLLQVNPKNLQIWDHMNAVSTKHFGLLAHDTHAHLPVTKHFSLSWPTYAQTFKLASNVVFMDAPPPPQFEARKKRLYEQIQNGRTAMLFDYLHPFNGNSWSIQCGAQSAQSGQRIPLGTKGCESSVQVPNSFPFPVIIKLIRNGRELSTSKQNNFKIQEPGMYRVEIWAMASTRFSLLLNEPVPYILYNPIYVD